VSMHMMMNMHMTGLGVGREGQANRSHDCHSDSNHSILLTLVQTAATNKVDAASAPSAR
jgi:hypothetical protein